MAQTDPHLLQGSLDEIFAQRIRQHCAAIPTLQPPELVSFHERHIQSNQPALIRGLVQKWPALTRWTFDFFRQELGAIEVTVNLYSSEHKTRMKLSELIRLTLDPAGAPPRYLQEWWYALDWPALKADFSTPDCFSDDLSSGLMGFNNSHIWIGGAGAFTPLHQDQMHAHIWSTQIRGTKRWFLFDRNITLHANQQGQPDVGRLLAEYPDGVFVVDLQPGEMLFVPYQWWHATQALDPCISLSNFYVTPDIVVKYVGDVMSIPTRIALDGEVMRENEPVQYEQLKNFTNILDDLLGLSKRWKK